MEDFVSTENGRKKKSEIIRQMEIDDLSDVYHLGEKLFTSDELPILYRTWDAHEVTEYFTSDSEYCLVAEVDGKLAGFIIANTIIKEGTAWKRYGYLAWIGVDEAFQRTGLGDRLYRKLEEKLLGDGVRIIMCDTEAGNKGAIKFFGKLGFTESAEHVWLAKNLGRARKTSGAG
jgi:ribosomal protein S18 acetylase RimI-like enzyme